jgi:hypothetical protein
MKGKTFKTGDIGGFFNITKKNDILVELFFSLIVN